MAKEIKPTIETLDSTVDLELKNASALVNYVKEKTHNLAAIPNLAAMNNSSQMNDLLLAQGIKNLGLTTTDIRKMAVHLNTILTNK